MIINFNKDIVFYEEGKVFDIASMYKGYKTSTKRSGKKKGKKTVYWEIPVALDLETTSTYIITGYRKKNKTPIKKKVAFAYIWMLQICEYSIVGRTWEEFTKAMKELHKALKTATVVVYVHNLGFDFSFFNRYIKIEEIFAVDKRKPIRVKTALNIEFRDSAVLAGKSLEKVGEELHSHKIKKLVGDLDYNKIRHCKTRMSFKELMYCVNDVKVLSAYIAECMEQDTMATIPMTATGYVRRDVRKRCFKDKSYRKLMDTLKIEPEEYNLLRDAFRGGFTHANANWVKYCMDNENHYLENVHSLDETSAYPSMMVSKMFPMSKGTFEEIKNIDDFVKYTKNYLWVGTIRFTNLRAKVKFEHILSKSACKEDLSEKYYDSEGKEQKTRIYIDNGRIVQAGTATVSLTNIDFLMMRKFYVWDSFTIIDSKLLVYKKGYLPKPIIESVLLYYEQKTTLKGVEAKISEYCFYKSLLNSIYGMMVQDIVNDIIKMDTGTYEWDSYSPVLANEIKHYNESKNRFTHYAWGVFITAYARQAIQYAILETADDHVYTDTDSEKFLNYEKHKEWFDNYNEYIKEEIKTCLRYYGIDEEKMQPKNIKGKKCPLGVFDYEGMYKKFRSCGSKRYFVEEYNKKEDKWEFNLTVSGLNKKAAVPYIYDKFRGNLKDIFAFCDDGMNIPEGKTGKLCRTYIDDDITVEITDYQGNTERIEAKGGCHLAPSGFNMGMDEYKQFLGGYLFDSSI